MDNIVYFPGCEPKPLQRDLVNQATVVLLKEVTGAYIEHHMEPGPLEPWYGAIQAYLWAAPIRTDRHGKILQSELKEWCYFWRNRALDRVATLL